MTPCNEAAYVATLILLYVDLPDTPFASRSAGPVHRSQAVSTRCSLAAGRMRAALASYGVWSGIPTCRNSAIRSLAYFQPVIAELQQQTLPDGYLDYLRLKFQKVVASAQKPHNARETLRRLSACDPQQRVPLPPAR